MPDVLQERANKAWKAHEKRFPAPPVEVVNSENGWGFQSPYRSADEEQWFCLLGEAFGTRTRDVISVFIGQLGMLIGKCWDAEAGRYVPNQSELQAALSIVAAMKPRNEAEAAQAAQAFALHIVAMRTGKHIAQQHGYIDPRQANALANLVKAYSGVIESITKGRRSGATKQTIIVKRETNVTYNDNRSVSLRGGGRSSGGQPDAPEGDTRARPANGATPCNGNGTDQLVELAALPGPEEVRETLPSASREGPERVPHARRKVGGGA